MDAGLRESLIAALRDASPPFRSMRLGQLICHCASLAGDGADPAPAEVEDEPLLRSTSERSRRRRGQLEGDPTLQAPPGRSREDLLQALADALRLRPDRRLGEFVDSLARSAGSNVYDAEDEQLIAAIRLLPPVR